MSLKSPCRPLPSAKRVGAGDALGLDDAGARRPLALQALAHRLAPRAVGREAVGAHALLREAGDLLRHRLGRLARLAVGHDLLAQADAVALLGRHLAARHDDLQRLAHADQARQAHRAAVDQRHAPAPAVDAEVGALRHHAHVAPHGELHAAGHGRALDRGDHGLATAPGARGPAARAAPCRRPWENRCCRRDRPDRGSTRLEVPAGAEGAALAPEHGHVGATRPRRTARRPPPARRRSGSMALRASGRL